MQLHEYPVIPNDPTVETLEKILHMPSGSRYHWQSQVCKKKGVGAGGDWDDEWEWATLWFDPSVFRRWCSFQSFSFTSAIQTNLVLSNQIHQSPLIFNQHVCFLWFLHLCFVIILFFFFFLYFLYALSFVVMTLFLWTTEFLISVWLNTQLFQFFSFHAVMSAGPGNIMLLNTQNT